MHSFASLAATNLMTCHTPQWWHPQLHCCGTQRDLHITFMTFPVLTKAGIISSYQHKLPAEKTLLGKTWNEQGSSYGGRRRSASTEDFPPCPQLCKKQEYNYYNNLFTSYGLDGPGIESWWGRDFPHLSRLALGPTQPPVQWVPGLSWGVKSGQGVTLTPHPLLVPRS